MCEKERDRERRRESVVRERKGGPEDDNNISGSAGIINSIYDF